ncbi:MAG: excisionase, partial [Ruminococcus sp.]
MNEIKLSEKFLLSIKEAALYFQIGEKKLRQLVKENPEANFYV